MFLLDYELIRMQIYRKTTITRSYYSKFVCLRSRKVTMRRNLGFSSKAYIVVDIMGPLP